MRNSAFIKNVGLFGVYTLSKSFDNADAFADYVMNTDYPVIRDRLNTLLGKTEYGGE